MLPRRECLPLPDLDPGTQDTLPFPETRSDLGPVPLARPFSDPTPLSVASKLRSYSGHDWLQVSSKPRAPWCFDRRLGGRGNSARRGYSRTSPPTHTPIRSRDPRAVQWLEPSARQNYRSPVCPAGSRRHMTSQIDPHREPRCTSRISSPRPRLS